MKYMIDDLKGLVECLDVDIHTHRGELIAGSVTVRVDPRVRSFTAEDVITVWGEDFPWDGCEVDKDDFSCLLHFFVVERG